MLVHFIFSFNFSYCLVMENVFHIISQNIKQKYIKRLRYVRLAFDHGRKRCTSTMMMKMICPLLLWKRLHNLNKNKLPKKVS